MSSPDNKPESVLEALASTKFTRGLTHDFYLYPARFSPEVARTVITEFTLPGDVVLDPFMGGGTSVVEGLRLGRRLIGVDINSLAHFVATARTTPLSRNDEVALRNWARLVASELSASDTTWIPVHQPTNLPLAAATFVSGALELLDVLPHRRQRALARCALLRLGQYYLEARAAIAPRRSSLARDYPLLVDRMLAGMQDFVDACRTAGVPKNKITSARTLYNRSAVGMDEEQGLAAQCPPKLVFTSPPYPGVHVLYHRWQYRSRRETPAPFWIADMPDGHGEKYYTGGSRTPTGLRNYFKMIRGAFGSVAKLLDAESTVVQLVGFSDVARQLPRYLRAMESAGFEECRESCQRRPSRRVPNRRWYAKMLGEVDASSEILLVHRLKR